MTITARSLGFLLLTVSLLPFPAFAGDSQSYLVHAQQLASRGEYDKAIDELKSGVSLYPYDATLKQSLADGYAQMGQRNLKQNRYQQAADYFGQAHDLLPDKGDYLLLRGIALYRDKKYDLARGDLQQAGEGAQPLIYLGKISYDTGDLPAAIAQWREAQERYPAETGIASLIAKAERELPVESRMDKGYSSMFDLSFDAELPQGLAAEVLDALESAYNGVGSDLGLYPATRIPVLLYTKNEYSSVTASPDWSGGLYDGKIRLPVGGVTHVSPQMRGVIFHEYTHVVIAQITGGNIPTWFNEGLAEIEGRKEYHRRTADLADVVKKKALLPLNKLSGGFLSMNTAEASIAYEQSHALTSFMVSRYGWYPVQEILKDLGERSTIEKATAKALTNWSLDLPGVMREWQESVSQ